MAALDTTDFTDLWHRMIEVDLRGRGISDPRVLMVMAEVPCEEFVPEARRDRLRLKWLPAIPRNSARRLPGAIDSVASTRSASKRPRGVCELPL